MKKILEMFWFVEQEEDILNKNLDILSEYINMFDEKHVALSFSKYDNMKKWKEIIKEKLGPDVIFHFYYNNPELGEATRFMDIIKKIPEYENDSIVFYCHSKGYSSRKNVFSKDPYMTEYRFRKNILSWINYMYDYCLYPIDNVEKTLSEDSYYVCYGPLKRNWNWGETCTQKYNWHYSGSFFWFNPSKLMSIYYGNMMNYNIQKTRFLSEIFLGDVIESKRAYGDYMTSGTDMYFSGEQEYLKLKRKLKKRS